MEFKIQTNATIYCKDGSYQKKYDNHDWYNHIEFQYYTGIQYYRGYLLHREDGPAVQWNNSYGINEYFLNGKRYSEKEYMERKILKSKCRVLDDI